MADLRILDLFSGIGGFSYAAERLVGGFTTVQFVEREPFCQGILSKHWPSVPIHDDICTFNPEPHSADVVCGGFPCQDISTAGKRAGIAKGTRSGLFYELMRVVRVVRPQYIVLENVAAIVSSGLDTVLGELATAGYDAEWACIRASDVGACHRRDRWWCVAYANDGGQQIGVQCDGESQQDWASQRYDADGLGADVADSNRLHCQRRGTTGNVAGSAGAGQVDGEQRQWDGDASDDCGAVAADTNNKGPQGRLPAGLCQHPTQRPAWPGDTPGGRLSPDWRSYVSKPVLCRGDDGLSGRVDRLKALGNSVVPQVAAIPLARVKALHHVITAC